MAMIDSSHFTTGFWLALGVLAAVVIASILMTVVRKVA